MGYVLDRELVGRDAGHTSFAPTSVTRAGKLLSAVTVPGCPVMTGIFRESYFLNWLWEACGKQKAWKS
jgi:hypothetical protein